MQGRYAPLPVTLDRQFVMYPDAVIDQEPGDLGKPAPGGPVHEGKVRGPARMGLVDGHRGGVRRARSENGFERVCGTRPGRFVEYVVGTVIDVERHAAIEQKRHRASTAAHADDDGKQVSAYAIEHGRIIGKDRGHPRQVRLAIPTTGVRSHGGFDEALFRQGNLRQLRFTKEPVFVEQSDGWTVAHRTSLRPVALHTNR